ncbi:glycosyltransferase family protein [Phormidium sp. CCY1219]|uniref:glycosyltransferase family protein n=1 Tax=Phormidium sp. CCY1219 TaxID=2886104 RepID=UPI002D1E9E23|nr:glycosyltransferase [Phormidium sp. CCY1219]MEB3827693.1 hypothetical protein [Phormidium sp. CCY1219]
MPPDPKFACDLGFLGNRLSDRVADILRQLTPAQATAIGETARKRVFAEHTYSHRTGTIDSREGWRTDPIPDCLTLSLPIKFPRSREMPLLHRIV